MDEVCVVDVAARSAACSAKPRRSLRFAAREGDLSTVQRAKVAASGSEEAQSRFEVKVAKRKWVPYDEDVSKVISRALESGLASC